MKIKILFINLFFLSVIAGYTQEPAGVQFSSIQTSMIWSTNQPDGEQVYVAFRKVFNLAEVSAPAMLQLFADSRYMLWVNGQYVLRGPCRFNPIRPEYDIVDINPHLLKGNNTIVILVHNYGSATNGRIMKHVPGLAAVLQISGKEIFHTDTSWRYNDKTRYQLVPRSWNSVPDVIDARIDKGEWILAGFDDSSWKCASLIEGSQWGMMYPREIPLAIEKELENLTILPQKRALNEDLPIELTAGGEILLDLGQMAMAYTEMVLEADSGSQLTIKYALRYKNGKPEEMWGEGNTYTACSGLQHFITTDQWAGHYVLVTCVSGRIKILRLKFTDRYYPFERIGTFECSDSMLTTLWDMAQKTIEVTSDDGYGSDARERNEWIQDAAKASFSTTRVASSGPGKDGKPVFSDPRLLKNMLRHAAQSQLPNGQIRATFPTDRGPEDCHYIIDDYSCQWFEALQTYYNSTADKEFVAEMWPALQGQINWFLKNRTSRGLLLAREYTSFDNPLAYITCEGSTINAFFYQALRCSEYLGSVLGKAMEAIVYRQAADSLYSAFNKQLWNDKEKAYNSAWQDDRLFAPTVHAQLMALQCGLVPDSRKSTVQGWFLANYKNPGMKHVCVNKDFEKMIARRSGIDMPVMYFWVFSELYLMDTEESDQDVLREIRRRWSTMVNFQQDAGTLSESFTDEKGEGASQSCHNYGAIPAYFLSTYVLGVKTDGPVWKKQLLIEPRLGDLTFAEGVVVTEHGPVPISWKQSENGRLLNFDISIPEGIHATVHLPNLSEKANAMMNGKILIKDGQPAKGIHVDGRWIVIQNVTGKCRGTLKL
jgi:alpha-L-rhamnosidase